MKTSIKILLGIGLVAIATFGLVKISGAITPPKTCPTGQFFSKIDSGGNVTCSPNSAAYQQISYIQNVATSTTNASAETSTISNVAQGDLLVAEYTISGTAATSTSFTDTNGTPILIASTTFHPSGPAIAYFYYEPGAASGTHTFHYNLSQTSSFLHLHLIEYSGVVSSSPIDSFVIATGTGSVIGSGNLAATALVNELILGYAEQAGGSLTAGSPYILRSATAFEDNSTPSLAAGTITSTTYAGGSGGLDWINASFAFEPGASSPAQQTTATSSLALLDTASHITAYPGASCAAGSLVTSVSASGTVTCVATSTILTGYSTSTNPGTVTTSSAGTTNALPIWTSASALGNSSVYAPSAKDITINSTTDNGLLSVVNASNTVAFSVATTTNPTVAFNIASGTASQFQIFTSGHVYATGTIPTMGTCGSSPSVVGSDQRGVITVGGGVVTSCTMNFQIPMETGQASCTESDNSVTVTGDISAITSSSVTFGFSATLGGGTIYYNCDPY